MKKLIYAMLALVGVLASSCSNDDIEIKTVGKLHTLTYQISTQRMYDTFDLTATVRDKYLRDEVCCIGLTTFIYNAEGNLVQKQFSSSYNFGLVTQEYKLEEGTYTAITVETLANPDDDFKMDNWEFGEEEHIRTLSIVNTNYKLGSVDAIGVSTKEIIIMDDAVISVEPNAIGSVVYVYFYEFENSTHNAIGFSTSDYITSYKLDPSLARNDRFVTDLTSTGYTNVRGNLTPAKIGDGYYLTLYLLESDIEWKFNFQESGETSWTYYRSNVGNATLEDGKIYYGGFYYYGESTVPASYFGDLAGFNNWLTEAEDKQPGEPSVTPLYTVPYINWANGTVASVKSYMSAFSLLTDITASSYEGYYMQYMSSDGTVMYEYDFTTRTGGLTDAYVVLDGESVTMTQLKSFLVDSGYVYDRSNDDGYWFHNSTTGVWAYLEDGVMIVNYYDPNAYSSTPRRTRSENLNLKGMQPRKITIGSNLVSMQERAYTNKKESRSLAVMR